MTCIIKHHLIRHLNGQFLVFIRKWFNTLYLFFSLVFLFAFCFNWTSSSTNAIHNQDIFYALWKQKQNIDGYSTKNIQFLWYWKPWTEEETIISADNCKKRAVPNKWFESVCKLKTQTKISDGIHSGLTTLKYL